MDMEGHQSIVQPAAGRQQAGGAPDDLGPGPLGQIDLVFHEVHHGPPRGQKVHRGQPVPGEERRYPVRIL